MLRLRARRMNYEIKCIRNEVGEGGDGRRQKKFTAPLTSLSKQLFNLQHHHRLRRHHHHQVPTLLLHPIKNRRLQLLRLPERIDIRKPLRRQDLPRYRLRDQILRRRPHRDRLYRIQVHQRNMFHTQRIARSRNIDRWDLRSIVAVIRAVEFHHQRPRIPMHPPGVLLHLFPDLFRVGQKRAGVS